jgi:arylsulfatase A-like enzyme
MAHSRVNKPRSLVAVLIFLTLTWIVIQVSLLFTEATTTTFFDTAVSSTLLSQIMSSRIFLVGLLQFLGAQFLLYSMFIALLWYVAIGNAEFFRFGRKRTYLTGVILFATSIVFICAANSYLVPHSYFSIDFNTNYLSGRLATKSLKLILTISGAILFLSCVIAISNMLLNIFRLRGLLRHTLLLSAAAGMFCLILNDQQQTQTVTRFKNSKPNVILIGIDALRPDFVGFNNHYAKTPQIDALLETSSNFSQAYTALARTFPSWTSILTGTYPKNNNARGNNTDLMHLTIDETLPKIFQAEGYETIYSTDDTRFNNINTSFGFDQVITPPMGLNDFLFGTLNDFPLSNLVIPTLLGKYLFPYNYANHGTAITYAPDNYLNMLATALQQRSDKPLFLAVHFTVTHWPFYWFNDRKYVACSELCRYQGGVAQSDLQLEKFLRTLRESHLLDHTIVVLLSDHGVSLGLHGDRSVSAKKYQGDTRNIKKLSVAKYVDAPEATADLEHDFGVDTAYGYGGDVLSMQQFHSVLAFKGYGVDIGRVQTINNKVMLLDIAPTLLALLDMPALKHADGISLTPLLLDQPISSETRPLFLESSFTMEEIEKKGISVNKVLAKAVNLYRLDKHTGLLFIKKDAEAAMDSNKQFAILADDWLLAYYPEAQHTGLVLDKPKQQMILQRSIVPPYTVLVNLKTGAWTTELDSQFAQNSPAKDLLSQLRNFYGDAITIH